MDAVLFAGNGNRQLARDIAGKLDMQLAPVEIVRFADSECRVKIEEDVAGKDVCIVQSLASPVDNNLIEFLFLADAIRREDARKIIGVLPYHGYARQDRVHRQGECLSSQVVAKLIESVGFDRLITMELHSEAILGFFTVPVTHLSALSLFYDLAKKIPGEKVIVAPDAGAMKRAQRFAHDIDAPLAFIEKKRDLHKVHTIASMKVVGEIKGETAIIVDDVIVTGGTIVNVAHLLKQKGAKQVIAAAVHADFVGGAAKILQESPIDAVWVSDTIELDQENKFPKLQIISSDSMIATAMRKTLR